MGLGLAAFGCGYVILAFAQILVVRVTVGYWPPALAVGSRSSLPRPSCS